jgi:LytS/YehU family sensor histidine kinase
VENALRHGLEPQIQGGEILIRAEERPGGYCIQVADTGRGFSKETTGGLGLANVRERLEALFPGKARLVLEENQPSGLKVTLEILHE